MWSIGEAERLKGSPPDTAEVTSVIYMNYTKKIAMGYIAAFLQNMFREDQIYVDPKLKYWSLSPDGEGKEGYKNFSQMFKELYKGYHLDKNMVIRADPETKRINLKQLLALFRSKDENLWKEHAWQFDGESRFLDGENIVGNKVAFSSWPRSGNSFLRKYFELLTGLATGADNTLHTEVIMQMQGFKGEFTVDDTTWICKTHSPWIMPEAPVFYANKMITIVRNPLDTFISWLNLVAQANHAQKAPFDYELAYPNYWDWWIHDLTPLMKKWTKIIMDDAKMRRVPTLFLRFEDLVADPET